MNIPTCRAHDRKSNDLGVGRPGRLLGSDRKQGRSPACGQTRTRLPEERSGVAECLAAESALNSPCSLRRLPLARESFVQGLRGGCHSAPPCQQCLITMQVTPCRSSLLLQISRLNPIRAVCQPDTTSPGPPPRGGREFVSAGAESLERAMCCANCRFT